MLSIGDVQGSLRKLETLLRLIKYPGYVDYSGLSKGDPSAFLPIVSFTLTSFSPPFAEQLIATGLELTGKCDLRFTDILYKVLRDIFHYRPILTKQQFLQWGFSQRKISVICDIINLVIQKHSQLKKPSIRFPASHKDGGEARLVMTDANTMSRRSFVVNHIENPATFPTNASHAEALSSCNVTYTSHNENGIIELEEGEEDKDNILHWSEVEERLTALEAQLEGLLSGLDKLRILEKRLNELERKNSNKVDKNEGQVITICRESWENLMSRVLLLETKLELSNIQLNALQLSPSPTTSYSSSSTTDVMKEDLKDRLESITNMLKSTCSLLKNTESSTTPYK